MVWNGANDPQEYITDEEQEGPPDDEATPTLDHRFYLTVTTTHHQRVECAYCGAVEDIDLDDPRAIPYDGVSDPLIHDDDCGRFED